MDYLNVGMTGGPVGNSITGKVAAADTLETFFVQYCDAGEYTLQAGDFSETKRMVLMR